MKVTQLTIRNTLGIEAATINLGDGLTVLAGKNGQGKTSALTSVLMALFGSKVFDGDPIKMGKDRATVAAALHEDGEDRAVEFVVTRTITKAEDGSLRWRLQVATPEGAQFNSPQSILDGLTGGVALDPYAFFRAKPKHQAEEIRKTCGLDFTEFEARQKATFEERTQINRDAKAAAAVLAEMPRWEDVPEEEVSVARAIDELQEAQRENLRRDSEAARVDLLEADWHRDLAADQVAVTEAEAEVKRLHEAYQGLAENLASARHEAARLRRAAEGGSRDRQEHVDAERASLVAERIDVQARTEALGTIEATNQKVRENQAHAKTQARLNALNGASHEKTIALDAMWDERAHMIASADMPVEGLSFNDKNEPTFDGLPLANASGAKRLEIGLRLAAARNPRLRFIALDNGEGLDDDHVEIVRQFAKEKKLQVLMTVVGGDENAQLVIEGGEIRPTTEPSAHF